MNILSFLDGMSEVELGKLLLGAEQDYVLEKAQALLNDIMENELVTFLEDAAKAPDGDFRNGYYSRGIATRIGQLTLRIPRDRLGKFKTELLEPYQRKAGDITDVIQTLYTRGMTENEIVAQLSDEFGISLSRETIRKSVNKVLGDAVLFNSRKIPDCPIVFLDGTYVPVKRRYDGTAKVEKECVMVALGITNEGKKVVLGFFFTPNEGAGSWETVLENLYSRGLASPKIFVTDGLQGMPDAIKKRYPLAKHQTCLVHVARNIGGDVRKSDRKTILGDFRKVYTTKSRAEATAEFEGFCMKWSKTYPSMVTKLRKRTGLFTFMEFPELLWKTIYTSNAIESFNSKLKRQTRKRILLNSEENGTITIAAVAEDYNKNAGKIRLRHFTELSEKEKEGLFLPKAE